MTTKDINETIKEEAVKLVKLYDRTLTDEEATHTIGYIHIKAALERMYIRGGNDQFEGV